MTDTAVKQQPAILREPTDDMDFANHLPEAEKLGTGVNVGRVERMASLVGGSALVVFGITRRSKGGLMLAAAAAGLIHRGATGHCPLYEKLSITTSGEDSSETLGIHVERAISIDKPRAELYSFWRNLENLPRFMEHLQSVWLTGDRTSHWAAKGPAGKSVEWDAEIINEQENELISWRSLDGSDVPNAGTVRFVDGPKGRGTEVHVTIQYYPPGGKFGAAIAKLFGEEPSIQVEGDLQRLKRLMETGEIATTAGQSHG